MRSLYSKWGEKDSYAHFGLPILVADNLARTPDIMRTLFRSPSSETLPDMFILNLNAILKGSSNPFCTSGKEGTKRTSHRGGKDVTTAYNECLHWTWPWFSFLIASRDYRDRCFHCRKCPLVMTPDRIKWAPVGKPIDRELRLHLSSFSHALTISSLRDGAEQPIPIILKNTPPHPLSIWCSACRGSLWKKQLWWLLTASAW